MMALDAPTDSSPFGQPFLLFVGALGPRDLRVIQLEGQEEMSGLYFFTLLVACTEAPGETSAGHSIDSEVLAHPACLVLQPSSQVPRAIHGVTTDLESLGPMDAHHRWFLYRLVLRPRLWLATLRRNTRIFENQTASEILLQVLGENLVAAELGILSREQRHEYVVQYRETDAEFVLRLMGEKGYYHYFRAPAVVTDALAEASGAGAVAGSMLTPDVVFRESETLVIADHALHTTPIADSEVAPTSLDTSGSQRPSAPDLSAPSLWFKDRSSGPSDEQVYQFTRCRTLRPKSTGCSNYDFNNPTRAIRSGASTRTHEEVEAGALTGEPEAAPALMTPERAEVYEHGGEYAEPETRTEDAVLMLHQHRRRAVVYRGKSWSQRLAPGHRFTLENAPTHELDGTYTVVAVHHSGVSPEWLSALYDGDAVSTGYSNGFECVPASLTYRPARPERRLWQVTETATVVGPEDIHTDAFARIRVRFHWDREDRCTCWLRTMQPWAGAAWGHQFIPRVGMEVVVGFLGGDPDTPVVLGALYNGTHPPPFRPPDGRFRSGIRTQSTPGGTAYNELSFADEQGQEEITLHAARDLTEEITNDHSTHVGHHQGVQVEGNRSLLVHLDSEREVLGDENLRTHGHLRTTVDQDAFERVSGNHWVDIGKDQSLQVAGNQQLAVEGASQVDIKDHFTLNTMRDWRTNVHGSLQCRVREDLTVQTTGAYTTIVGDADNQPSYALHVEGTADVYSADTLRLTSDTEIVLQCGESQLRIGPSRILVQAGGIHLAAGGSAVSLSKNATMKGGDAICHLSGGKALLKGASALVALESDAEIDGAMIKLKSGSGTATAGAGEEDELTVIELKDESGKPLPFRPFVIYLEDGTRLSGALDQEGRAELVADQQGEIFFPGLTDLTPG